MKKPLLILVFLLFTNAAFIMAQNEAKADEPTVFERWPSSLGFYVHSLNGFGLSWQHWYDRFGLALAAGGLYDPDASTLGAAIDYNVQGIFSYAVYKEDFADWFSGNLQLGVYLAHRGLQELSYLNGYYMPLEPSYVPALVPFVASVHGGIGVAIEIVLFGHFSFVSDLMYVLSWPLALNLRPDFSFRYRY